ncbi:MAG: ROK family protein [Bacillota bacterium]|nr:ROK family protein [Bacillota bacterium]
MPERLILGIDIGGTKTAVSLSACDRYREPRVQILGRTSFATEPEAGFPAAWEKITAAAGELLAAQGCHRGERWPEAVGISCGGPLNSAEGVILNPPHLPGWVNIPLVRLAEEAFGIPAFLENDAKAGALVEWKLGAGIGTKSLIFATMGTGFGSGLILDGRLLQGPTFTAGEIGHVRLHDDGPTGFGKAGSVEGFISGSGIAKLCALRESEWQQAGDPPAWLAAGESPDAGHLAALARAGDPHARRLYTEVGRHLGQCLANLIDLLNPECIVLGSIFVRAEDLLRPSMEAVIAAEALPSARAACRIVPAASGEAIGDLAACLTAAAGLGIELALLPAADQAPVLAQLDRLMTRHPALAPCRADILAVYRTLVDSYLNGGKLLTAGNGGSAADAEHIVGELMKSFRLPRPIAGEAQLQGALPALSLTGHPALATAWQNDADAAWTFAQILNGLGEARDCLLLLSTSGNSANLIHAAHTARRRGIRVLGLLGRGGGRLAPLCDAAIIAPGSDTDEIQEYHLPIYHCLCAMLETRFFDPQVQAGP